MIGRLQTAGGRMLAGALFLGAVFAIALAASWRPPALADEAGACARHLPLGRPQLDDPVEATAVCHAGYFAYVDNRARVPRYVAYDLRGPDTLGCNARGNKFHADELVEDGATPKDYTGTGYDRGHQAPAADFASDADQSFDSFSMANMAPQKPGLNRAQWERLEESVRAWAWSRGELLIYVGPVLAAKPKTIGAHHVAVPSKFWKVILDRDSADALAFMLPQKSIPKGKLDPWQVTIADVEAAAAIALPLPHDIARDTKSKLWPADLKGWAAAHRKACAR